MLEDSGKSENKQLQLRGIVDGLKRDIKYLEQTAIITQTAINSICHSVPPEEPIIKGENAASNLYQEISDLSLTVKVLSDLIRNEIDRL